MNKKVKLFVFLFLLCFLERINAQQIRKMKIEPMHQEGISVQISCKDAGDANIFFYSKIGGLKFESTGGINEVPMFKSEKNLYILCVDPGITHIIKISHPDFAEGSKEIDKLSPGEVIRYNVDEEIPISLPTFDSHRLGEFHLHSNPEGAIISLEGQPDFNAAKHVTPYKFLDYKAGTYKIHLVKEKYKPVDDEITISEQHGNKTISLTPLTGLLTINAENQEAIGSKVIVNEKVIGHIPLNKVNYAVGNYTIFIEKPGFARLSKKITINENQETQVPIKLLSTKEVVITSNQGKAKVFIDLNYVGKTPLSYDLSIDESHTIKVQKDHFVPEVKFIKLSENSPNSQPIVFELKEVSYIVSVTSKPKNVYFSIDGVPKGRTPSEVPIPYGEHKVEFYDDNYFSKVKNVYIAEETKQIKGRLFPNSKLYYLGVSGGLSLWNMSFNMVQHRFFFGAGFGANLNDHKFDRSISVTNADVDDLSSYNSIGTTAVKDSSRGYNGYLKIGLLVQSPFPLIINVGWAGITSRYFQKVYQAKHDYSSTNGTFIKKDEYFTSSKIYLKGYNALIIGLTIPLNRNLFISADYYTTSEVGSGLAFGGGFNFKR